jgi:hypothetical protein
MMSPFSSALSSNLGSCLSELSTFGQIDLPEGCAELTFQIDIQPSESPEELWFGLLNLSAESHHPVSGFAIRLDLNRGEIWDAQNGFGLLGTFETGPLWQNQFDADETLLLCFKIAKHGPNLVPTLHLGDSTHLYPSLSTTHLNTKALTAVAGAVQPGRDAEPFCHFPAFWLTESAS